MEYKEGIYNPEQKEKPKFLYHASSNRDVNEFVPHQRTVRDLDEGPRVFATPDKKFASIFLIDGDDSWIQSGKFDDQAYIIVADKKRFFQQDKGGAIYKFSSDSFECDEKKGLGELEWTSKISVKPVEKEEYESALDAMLENNVAVYFVNQETFEKIKNSNDYGRSIIEQLSPLKK